MTTQCTADGFFGEYGGQYVPEPLIPILNTLAEAFEKYRNDPEFIEEFNYYLKHFSGRETPLYFCENLTEKLGGAKIYLKREDLNHLGAHKVNNTIGQILLAKRMGKKKIIAETGAGQHGVATAATAALMGMECTITWVPWTWNARSSTCSAWNARCQGRCGPVRPADPQRSGG